MDDEYVGHDDQYDVFAFLREGETPVVLEKLVVPDAVFDRFFADKDWLLRVARHAR